MRASRARCASQNLALRCSLAQPKMASRKKSLFRGERAFLHRLQARIAARKNAHRYDEIASVLAVGEYDGSGNLIEETVWLGDIPVATLRPNGSGGINVFYIHTDALNTPRKISQPTTGTLAWRWDADPFGIAAPNQNPGGLGTFISNERFPGQYYQAETGLNQNVNRDYDPQAGGYIEGDPLGLEGGINPYAYANANPVSLFDSTGQQAAVAAPAAIVVVGTAAIVCSTTSICSDAVKSASNAISQAASGCPKDKCAELQAGINELVRELKSRQLEALTDKNDLFTNRFFGPFSWMGHRWWYENMVLPDLAADVAEAKALGCPYDPEADIMLTKPYPDAPVRCLSGPRQ
jgi:RHS repeat-associated protein